jgi:hypothetical protein
MDSNLKFPIVLANHLAYFYYTCLTLYNIEQKIGSRKIALGENHSKNKVEKIRAILQNSFPENQ